jgi:hypothetical protein
MPQDKEIRQEKKRDIDKKALLDKYGKDQAPDFEPLINALLSKPSQNAPAKIAKR